MGQPTNASQAISTDNSDFTFGVAAFSSTLAWSVTYAGNARRTTDGGATWTEYVVTGASKLTAVAADRNDGTGNTWYAVGINGAVYKSTNGAGGAPTWALATAQPSSAGWPAGSDAYAVAVFKDAGLVTNVILTGDNGWTALQHQRRHCVDGLADRRCLAARRLGHRRHQQRLRSGLYTAGHLDHIRRELRL